MLSVNEALDICRKGGDFECYSHVELRVALRDLANLYEQTERCRLNAVAEIDRLKIGETDGIHRRSSNGERGRSRHGYPQDGRGE